MLRHVLTAKIESRWLIHAASNQHQVLLVARTTMSQFHKTHCSQAELTFCAVFAVLVIGARALYPAAVAAGLAGLSALPEPHEGR